MPAPSTRPFARTRRRATRRSPSPWPTCRRCFIAPATSTARGTAAASSSTSRAGSGPRRSAPAGTTRRSCSTRGSASAHIFIERSAGPGEGTARRPRRAGRGRLPHPRRARRQGRLAGAGGDGARGGAALLADRRTGRRLEALGAGGIRPDDRARARARLPRSLLLGGDLRLQGDGRAEGARGLLPGPSRRALRDDRLLRPQPLLDQHLALVQAGAAVLGARAQRRDQHHRPAPPGGEDAGRPDPAGLLGLPGPEPRDRHADSPRRPVAGRGDGDGRAADRQRDPLVALRPARLLHVPAPGDGAVRPGAGRADRPPPRGVRLLGRRPRPAPAVEAGDARRLHLQLRARRGQRPRHGLRAAAAGPGREVPGHDRRRQAPLAAALPPRDAAPRRRALGRAHGRRGCRLRPRADDRRAARGLRDPRLHLGRAVRAGQGRGPRPRRLRVAARRRQALPADGLQRRRADRLARLRRCPGRALPGAPEPRRLLQGDGGRRHQPGDRPRARDGALLGPVGLRAAPVDSRPRHRHRHRRDLVPGDPRRSPRPRPAVRLDLPQDRPRPSDLPARGPVGGVPRPRRGDRHGAARVRDHPRRDRPHPPGGRQARRPGRRADGPHRPRRLRRRAPLPGPAPGAVGRRSGAEGVQGRPGRGEPAPALLDRAAVGGDPQRPRRGPRARHGRERRLPVRDGRGDLRRRLRRRRLQPLRCPAQGNREGDLDDRHPRGPRLRPPVLVDRGQARARRDLPDAGLRRLGRWRDRVSPASTADADARHRILRGDDEAKPAKTFRFYPKVYKAAIAAANGTASYEEYSQKVRDLEAQSPISMRHIMRLRSDREPIDAERASMPAPDITTTRS